MTLYNHFEGNSTTPKSHKAKKRKKKKKKKRVSSLGVAKMGLEPLFF
jgi:hypothetical protein